MIILLVMMTGISFGMRFIPFLISDRFQKIPLIEKLSSTLPTCILLILVAHTLEGTKISHFPFGIPELSGLITVVLIQIAFRNILASMFAGMIIHQVLLHYLI